MGLNDLTNAGEELRRHLGERQVDYGYVKVLDDDGSYMNYKFNETFDTFELFDRVLIQLDEIDYDSSYGQQWLYGIVVFTDGAWLERGEYDGKEWWKLCSKPSWKDVVIASQRTH